MIKLGEELYSAETVKAFLKHIYHLKESDFLDVSPAERRDTYFLAYSYTILKPDKAAVIVARGTLDQEMRDSCEGWPVTVEMRNNNQYGDYCTVVFCFPLDS